MHACYARAHAFSKSLISIWARWPVGFGASVRAAPFSASRSCQPVLPLQPTPTGAFEKVRFAVLGALGTNTSLFQRAALLNLAGTRLHVPAGQLRAAQG